MFAHDDEAEVGRAVARLSAQRADRSIEGLSEALAAVDAERRADVGDLLAALAALNAPFTREEFEELKDRLRVPGPADRLLASLVADSLVFEPRPGLFRLLA